MNGSSIRSNTEQGTGRGGAIIVDASNSVFLSGGSTIQSSTTTSQGDPAGSVTVKANNLVSLSGAGTGLLSESGSSTSIGTGNGGAIMVLSDQVQITNGAVISAISNGVGNSGTVTVEGTQSPAQSVLIDGPGSGIFTDTQGIGVGGNITLNANSVVLQNGGTLSAATSGTSFAATGGTIMLEANQVQLNNGGLITASTTGAGDGGLITIGADSTFMSNASTVSSTATQAQGGDIAITAGQSATLNNGASISASSTGAGDAGNIDINAGQSFVATNSSVTTQANQASRGSIKITTSPSGTVQLTNSLISASVLDGTGGGGSVDIDPLFVILLNSQILAQAVQGPGGNIFITTNFLLPDANSVISASSQFGVNGTVTIQSPNAPGSGKIQPQGKSPLLATSLFNQRCAALAGGEFSSFTVAGRDSLPTEPGSWLASPLALSPAGFSAGIVTAGGEQAHVFDPADETPLLSLRQIAPAGFLTQAFAVDRSVSCQS